MFAKVVIITCSKSHSELWAELDGTSNENLWQLTRRLHEEIEIIHDNVEEQKQLVIRMREAVARMRDPANWDREELFGEWDGAGSIPDIAASSRDLSHSLRRPKKRFSRARTIGRPARAVQHAPAQRPIEGLAREGRRIHQGKKQGTCNCGVS